MRPLLGLTCTTPLVNFYVSSILRIIHTPVSDLPLAARIHTRACWGLLAAHELARQYCQLAGLGMCWPIATEYSCRDRVANFTGGSKVRVSAARV